MSGTIKLYYFNARGRAEPIRLCLAAAGKDYEDIRLTQEEWQSHKPRLAGKTSQDQLRVDQVFCLTGSLTEAMSKAYFEQDKLRKAEMTTELRDQTIPKFLGFFEKLLTESGTGHFVGNELTLADLTVQNITFALRQTNANLLDDFPEIQKMIKNVEGHEKVKTYLDSRPVTEM